jgi:acyl phosphate:glycerol-3-phosphate acyltransferase
LWSDFVIALVGYFCGSIPFGLIFTRMAGLGDIRKIGSGNIGATNVLRTGNRPVAGLTLLCDALKGLVPVYLATRYGGGHAPLIAGFAALVGHVFPVWLGFKGGKGVATALGVLLGWSWIVALAGLVCWGITFALTRISSLSALAACVLTAPAAYVLERMGYVSGWSWPAAALALFILATHHQNIARLLRGEEGQSKLTKSK